MDSEGFFGPGVSEDYDAKIFTLATLLGSFLVYNTIRIIDQQARVAFFCVRPSRPDSLYLDLCPFASLSLPGFALFSVAGFWNPDCVAPGAGIKCARNALKHHRKYP